VVKLKNRKSPLAGGPAPSKKAPPWETVGDERRHHEGRHRQGEHEPERVGDPLHHRSGGAGPASSRAV
jgi:hypothetical protein